MRAPSQARSSAVLSAGISTRRSVSREKTVWYSATSDNAAMRGSSDRSRHSAPPENPSISAIAAAAAQYRWRPRAGGTARSAIGRVGA